MLREQLFADLSQICNEPRAEAGLSNKQAVLVRTLW